MNTAAAILVDFREARNLAYDKLCYKQRQIGTRNRASAMGGEKLAGKLAQYNDEIAAELMTDWEIYRAAIEVSARPGTATMQELLNSTKQLNKITY